MRIRVRSTLSLLTAVAIAAPASAQQNARANLVVTAQWLSQHLSDSNLVLLHVSDRADYDKAHIPGARFTELHEVATLRDEATRLTLQFPSDDTLRTRLSRLGISDHSRIIVYFSNGFVAPSTRVALTLDYAGLGASTSMLDGGIASWTRAGFVTTTVAPAVRVGTLSPLNTRPVVVTADFVRDNVGKPGFAVVDARAAAFYSGVSEGGPQDARKRGHITGALNVPFSQITADNFEFKSAEELGALFTKAGVKPGDTIIAYCHIGQQATTTLFAARTLGYNVLLFDGSFEDWARRGWSVTVPPAK